MVSRLIERDNEAHHIMRGWKNMSTTEHRIYTMSVQGPLERDELTVGQTVIVVDLLGWKIARIVLLFSM